MAPRANGKWKMGTVAAKAMAAMLVTLVLGGRAGAHGATDSTGAPRAVGSTAGTTSAAADPLPFFKPDPTSVIYGPPLPDPAAPECAVGDWKCLEAHDAAALSGALAAEDDASCDEARQPDACRAAYAMITGNVGMKADPILDDPCSWVMLVDHGVATIESKRNGAIRRYADRGWKPRTFLGKCDLSRLSSRGDDVTVPLPSWVAPRSAVLQTSGLATTMTVPTPRAPAKPAPASVAAMPLAAKKP